MLLAVVVGIAVIGAGPYLYLHVLVGAPPAAPTLPAAVAGAAGPLGGTWQVTKSSQVEYRVTEMLFGQHGTAVGRTSEVTGTMAIAGATVTSAHFDVAMGSVVSGQAGRDVTFRDGIMDTGAHPKASFTLIRPIDLGSLPPAGQVVTVQAVGSLRLRGVTRTVSFPLRAERVGAGIDVNGSLRIVFSLWHIPNPSFAIARVGSSGTLVVLLHFSRAG